MNGSPHLPDGRTGYIIPEHAMSQVISLAVRCAWEHRDAQSQQRACPKCQTDVSHSHELHPMLLQSIVTEVKAAIDMAVKQAGEKPKRPILYGPDGDTPVSLG